MVLEFLSGEACGGEVADHGQPERPARTDRPRRYGHHAGLHEVQHFDGDDVPSGEPVLQVAGEQVRAGDLCRRCERVLLLLDNVQPFQNRDHRGRGLKPPGLGGVKERVHLAAQQVGHPDNQGRHEKRSGRLEVH